LQAEPVSDQEGWNGGAAGKNGASFFRRLPRRLVQWSQSASARFTPRRPGLPVSFSLPFQGKAEVLIIVPPFASLWYPSLGAHVLQGCAQRAGFSADVLYASVLLAAEIGEAAYEQIGAESIAMAGERYFARSAFGLPPLGHAAELTFDARRIYGDAKGELYRGLYPDGRAASMGGVKPITLRALQQAEKASCGWVDRVARAVIARGYKIVGCTTTFQQTNASVALLNRVKELDPAIVTVLGGANCEGEMAEGVASLKARIDYIFSGESEETFPAFLHAVLSGAPPREKIIQGRPCMDMDALPLISSREFFEQRAAYLPDSAPASSTYLTFETSRGCWWGQKQHCTFCGLNGEGMAFRRKSPERVVEELRGLMRESPTRNVSMTDNIMPREYLKTLLPRLSHELPEANVFYEQKSNLSFDEVMLLRKAGVSTIQPGIEALSTSLLKLMRKGVQAHQNLMLLRYGRMAGVNLVWNMICGFPNDELAAYRETMALVPLITHLQPPSGLWHLSIDRFSPYFFDQAAYKITDVRPLPLYRDFLPEGAAVEKIAYHFLGEYPCDTHRSIDFVREVSGEVRKWVEAWQQGPERRPELKICRDNGEYVIVDTRGLPGTEKLKLIEPWEAAQLMNARPYSRSREEDDFIRRKLAVVADKRFVPLPVARQEIFLELSLQRPGHVA
jgi:ribosomal peptide maturation radical SAM protein 1